MVKKINGAFLGILLALITACGSGQEGGTTIDQAKAYLNQGDYRSAMLTLKNIIKDHPDDKTARLLLAKVYLPTGDGASAEKELKRAKRLGATENEYVVSLAKALLLQAKPDEALVLTKPLDGADASLNAEILSVKGDAYIAKNNIQKAKAAYQQALKYDASNKFALQGLIKLSVVQNDIDAAQKLVTKLLQLAPEDPSTWDMKGFVESAKQQHAESELSYQKAIDLLHEKQITRLGFSLRSGLIQEQLKQGQYNKALDNINVLLKAQPKHPLPKYMRALIAYEQKDYDLADNYLRDVIHAVPNYLPGRLLMGSVQFALGNYEQARDNLQRVINEVPTHLQARKMLASVYFKLRNPEDALEVLSANKGEASDDAQLLSMMGKAALFSGDMNRGLALYKKAASAAPKEASIRTELASLYLNKGEYKSAIEELEQIGGADKKQAKKMIIYAHIREQEYDKALAMTKELAAEAPGDASVPAIFGAIELSRGERGKAREYFLKSHSMDKDFEPALNSLARMDFEDGNLEGAEGWYNQIIQQNPSSLRALLGMAQIADKRGKIDKALAWVEKAVETNPKALAPIVILTNYHLKNREFQKADDVIAKAEQALPGSLQLEGLKAKSLLAQGKTDEVIEILNKLIQVQPRNATHYLQLAAVLDRANRLAEARSTLLLAKEKISATPKIVRALVKVEAKMGHFDKALALIKEQKKEPKTAAIWYDLEGDVYLQQKKYRQAEKAYKLGAKSNDSYTFASKVAISRYAAGDASGAIDSIKAWLKRHPKDVKGALPLAQLYIKFGKFKEAIPLFEKINNSQASGNALILNNLAWLYSQVHDSRALATAKQAYLLAPTSGAVADTYGWLLVEAGEVDRGIDLLRKAADLVEGNQEIQLHLASALVQKGGNREEAKLLVQSLMSDGKLKDHTELQKLQKKLGLL